MLNDEIKKINLKKKPKKYRSQLSIISQTYDIGISKSILKKMSKSSSEQTKLIRDKIKKTNSTTKKDLKPKNKIKKIRIKFDTQIQ